ncbi:YfiR family protein [Ferruginibacter albus]|uniref:YfiR family protein n=1 Tax=Ferruginibacter albus TaxID=2875540 RepID=UPI001CC47979|nr:YfiR family protein [Ferruginibacter albus]UAY51078.1 YfiR family protein [Ferruginibacter albus]
MIAKRIITVFTMSMVMLMASSFSSFVPDPEQEYALKAAFLYRFADYIDWPEITSSDNFVITVLGESAITPSLNEIAKAKKIKNKIVSIKVAQNINDISDCQILFISKGFGTDISAVTSKLGNRPVLIVTEQKDACTKGAHINFFIGDNKLKFEINLKAASQAGIKISSQLLQHAAFVINN